MKATLTSEYLITHCSEIEVRGDSAKEDVEFRAVIKFETKDGRTFLVDQVFKCRPVLDKDEDQNDEPRRIHHED